MKSQKGSQAESGQALIEYLMMTSLMLGIATGVLWPVFSRTVNKAEQNIAGFSQQVISQDQLGIPLEWFGVTGGGVNPLGNNPFAGLGSNASGSNTPNGSGNKNSPDTNNGSGNNGKGNADLTDPNAASNKNGARGKPNLRSGPGNQNNSNNSSNPNSANSAEEEAKKEKNSNGKDSGNGSLGAGGRRGGSSGGNSEDQARNNNPGSKGKVSGKDGDKAENELDITGQRKAAIDRGLEEERKGCNNLNLFTIIKIIALAGLLFFIVAVMISSRGKKGDD